MATLLFANNASTTLAGSLTIGATTASVATGTGALFPQPTAGQYFVLSLFKAGTPAVTEICWCTAITGDNLTIVRAKEGTTALAWSVGDIAVNDNTAGTMRVFPQPSDVQTQAGNYAADSGTANAMVVTLSPAPASEGVPIRLKKSASANTSATTMAVNGFAATAVKTGNAAAMTNGQLPAHATFEVVYNSTLAAFVLQSETGVLGTTGVTAGTYDFATVTVGADGRVDTIAAGADAGTGTIGVVALATAAEVAGLTDATHAVTPLSLGENYFLSSARSLALTGEVSVPHSLSARPLRWGAYIQCTTAEFGYSIGDVVQVPFDMYDGHGGGPVGLYSLWADATNVGISMQYVAGYFYIVPKAGTSVQQLTIAHWALYLWASLLP